MRNTIAATGKDWAGTLVCALAALFAAAAPAMAYGLALYYDPNFPGDPDFHFGLINGW